MFPHDSADDASSMPVAPPWFSRRFSPHFPRSFVGASGSALHPKGDRAVNNNVGVAVHIHRHDNLELPEAMNTHNKITGSYAAGPRWLPFWVRWTARFAQIWAAHHRT
jgi:hypothetical protein